MRELLRTSDLVHLSWAQAVLAEAGIAFVMLDESASGVVTGAIPRRLMVRDDELARARHVLEQAGRDLPGG